MLIRWLGHAAFYIEAAGRCIVCDPYDQELGYPLPDLEADIVTTSHGHWDHCATHVIKGEPRVINETGVFPIDRIIITGIASFHDRSGGKERGPNVIYKIQAEDITLVHLGDLGHLLNPQQLEEIGVVDILLLPVGGIFTLDAAEAWDVVKQLEPRIIIPMHYQTEHLCFTLGVLEAFTNQFDQIIKKGVLEISSGELPHEQQVMVLDYLAG